MTARLATVALLVVALDIAVGCGGSHDDGAAGTAAGHDAHAEATSTFEGGVISPRRAAPPLALKDIDGRTVDISSYRGEPVLVTFVYATCPDVGPLIMENLRRVRAQAGPRGERLKVIAVSVDPEGDTVPVVRGFLAKRRVAGFVDYLVGSRPVLEKVWADWQVGAEVPKDDPELVEHSALIYGVTSGGELATAYPVGFKAAAIVRDLPKLAAG